MNWVYDDLFNFSCFDIEVMLREIYEKLYINETDEGHEK